MPALPPAPLTTRIDLQYTYGEDASVLNRFFWVYNGTPPTETVLNTWASSIASAFNSDLAPLMSTVVSLTGVVIDDLNSNTGARGVWSGTHSGGLSSAHLDAGTAAVFTFKVARRYRGGHPRCYMPFGDAAQLADAQKWNNTFLTNCTSGWTSFATAIDALSGGGAAMVEQANVSYYLGGTWHQYPSGIWRRVPTVRTSPLVEPITEMTPRPNVGSQRRRNLA
jgi:hypothetical protein